MCRSGSPLLGEGADGRSAEVETQEARTASTVLQRKEVRGRTLPGFQTHYKVTAIRTVGMGEVQARRPRCPACAGGAGRPEVA